jgi:hypothetical protein
MTDIDIPLLPLAIAALIVLSAVALPIVPTGGPSGDTSGTVSTPDPVTADVDDASAPTPGSTELYALPDDRTVTQAEGAEAPALRASEGSQTMDARVTTAGGELALELEDDRTHDGRWVSIPTDWFTDELGSVPAYVTIRHESGDRYNTKTYARSGGVAFYVEEFSTNTVTFSGTTEISASPASDGASFEYELSNLDSASNVTVNLTGKTNSEFDNESGSGISGSASESISVGGNLNPTDGAGNDPLLTISDGTIPFNFSASSLTESTSVDSQFSTVAAVAVRANGTELYALDSGGNTVDQYHLSTPYDVTTASHSGSFSVDGQDSTPQGLDISPGGNHLFVTGQDYDKIYQYELSTAGDITSASYVREIEIGPGTNPNPLGISFGDKGKNAAISYQSNDQIYHLTLSTAWDISTASRGSGVALPSDPSGIAVSNDGQNLLAASRNTAEIHSYSLSTAWDMDTATLDSSTSVSGSIGSPTGIGSTGTEYYIGDGSDNTITQYSQETLSGASVTIGANTLSYGDFAAGESKSTYANITTETDSLEFSSSTGSLDFKLLMAEQTVTTDPTVELNSEAVSHSGTIADGETTSLSIPVSELQEGTNRVNVSVGDGTLSADAPEPVVGLDYSHTSAANVSTDFTSGKWIESYNVSRTFADDRANATLTIPFESTVYAIKSVETQSNGSAWTATTDYTLDGSTLTVQLGDVTAGETVAVSTTGYRYQPVNASVTVTEPTTSGDLDSRIRVDSWDSSTDSYLSIGGTPDGERLHYVHDASYADDHELEVTADGNHRLFLPNAAGGDELNVSTVPYRTNVKTGEVRYSITDTTETNLTLDVKAGASFDDDVEFTYLNATDGETYVLYSESADVVRDQQTASSPVTLTDDDSAELLSIFVDDDAGGSSGGGAGAGAIVAPTSTGDPQFLPLAGVALALGLLVVVARRNETVADAGSDTANAVSDAIPVAGPVIGGVVRTLSQSVAALFANRIVAVLLGGAISVAAVQGGIIRLGPSTEALAAIVIVGIGSLVALQEVGEFTARRWVALLAATTIVSLQLLGSGDIITAVVDSQVFPLVALVGAVGALWLIQGLRQGLSSPDQVTEIVVDGNRRDGD